MGIHLDPFNEITAIQFGSRVKCRTNGGHVIVKANGVETQKLHSAPALSAGFAVAGTKTFFVDGDSSPLIQRYDIELDSYQNFTPPSPVLFRYNDCACDGTHVYAAGYDGGSNYVIEKWTLDGVMLWVRVLSGYLGGAVSICANQLGFLITSNDDAQLFDPDGTFIASCTVTNNIAREWDIAATRDRFWYGDTINVGGFDLSTIRGVDITGAQKTFIDLSGGVPESGWYAFAITESNLFVFVDIDFDSTNTYALVFPRTVTRDQAGDIVTDVFNLSSKSTFTLTPTDFWYKAAVDSTTYLNF